MGTKCSQEDAFWIRPMKCGDCTPYPDDLASLQRVPGLFPRGLKRLGGETNPSHRCSARLKNAWSYIFSPPYGSILWCLITHRNIFTFISHIFSNLSLIKSLYCLMLAAPLNNKHIKDTTGLDSTTNPMNPLQTLANYLSMIHFNILHLHLELASWYFPFRFSDYNFWRSEDYKATNLKGFFYGMWRFRFGRTYWSLYRGIY
jgi:hypothetical protein